MHFAVEKRFRCSFSFCAFGKTLLYSNRQKKGLLLNVWHLSDSSAQTDKETWKITGTGLSERDSNSMIGIDPTARRGRREERTTQELLSTFTPLEPPWQINKNKCWSNQFYLCVIMYISGQGQTAFESAPWQEGFNCWRNVPQIKACWAQIDYF